jgi:hypothetical protein
LVYKLASLYEFESIQGYVLQQSSTFFTPMKLHENKKFPVVNPAQIEKKIGTLKVMAASMIPYAKVT